jgi:uncharacterized membrane protein YhiD involved in acid resistance
MRIHLLSVSILPLQQAAGGATATSIQVAAEISTIVIAVVSVFLLLVALALVLQVKKLLGSLAQQVQPVTDRARVAAENVEYISAMVREDVQSVRTSVSGLSERLKDASDRMEERVEEFNALMDVVQDEAEAVLLDTAAVVRGVRAGAQTMGEGVAGVTPAGDAEGSLPPDGEDDSEGESDVGEAMAREAPETG